MVNKLNIPTYTQIPTMQKGQTYTILVKHALKFSKRLKEINIAVKAMEKIEENVLEIPLNLIDIKFGCGCKETHLIELN